MLRDVSDRKAQELTIDAARADTERASAAKSRFIATMSHELRTPLNAIIGFSDMLTNETIELDAARRLDYARLINDSGRHLLAVVNGILDVSKMETGNFEITREPFAPASAIESCTDLLALKARDSGIELKLRLAHGLPDVAADRRAFNQVLINLISNAIKFTPRGGAVTVSALCDGPNFAVTVEDNGVGIGEADLPRLGEAFFQADASYDRRQDGSGPWSVDRQGSGRPARRRCRHPQPSRRGNARHRAPADRRRSSARRQSDQAGGRTASRNSSRCKLSGEEKCLGDPHAGKPRSKPPAALPP